MIEVERRKYVSGVNGASEFIYPNVYPDHCTPFTQYRDIIKGHVPLVGPDDEYPVTDGWLKLAVGEVGSPGYVMPETGNTQDSALRDRANRKSENLAVEVRESYVVKRQLVSLNDIFSAPKYNHVGLGITYLDPDSEDAKKVESAVAFSGVVVLGDDEKSKQISGVHFRSGRIQGWARILDY